MKHTKVLLLSVVALALISLMLSKVKPVPKGDDRIWNDYLKAEAPILVTGSGTKDTIFLTKMTQRRKGREVGNKGLCCARQL
ncbi:MAG: hypothetical protein ACXW3L_09795 [Limisphaerales bacterium]